MLRTLLKKTQKLFPMSTAKLTIKLKGGPGSGHKGHAGRPGRRGGSAPGTGGNPVHASLSKDGKYEERPTEGGLHYILAATSHTWDETAIHPDKFSPDAEIQLMKDANAHMRGLLSDPEMADFIKRIDRDGDALISHGSDDKYTIGTNIIFTGDPSMVGAGSGGPGSSKIFWVPYSADEEAFSKAFRGDTQSQSAFGVDPLYVAFHEMHHAYGSNTELDMFSDFAALDFHLSRGNTTQMKAAVDAKLDSMFMWASGQASGEWKQDRLDTRAALGRLYSRNPAATEDWVANSWFGGNDDSRTKMLARLRSWRNS